MAEYWIDERDVSVADAETIEGIVSDWLTDYSPSRPANAKVVWDVRIRFEEDTDD